MTKNIDEDPAVKHWLAVNRRDQVGNFLLCRKIHILGCENYISGCKEYALQVARNTYFRLRTINVLGCEKYKFQVMRNTFFWL